MYSFSKIFELLENNHTNLVEFYTNSSKISKKFSEVAQDVKLIIRYLESLSLKKDDRIGILSNNCYEYILLDIACIYSGIVSVHFQKKEQVVGNANIYQVEYLFTSEEINTQPLLPVTNIISIQNLVSNAQEIVNNDSLPLSKHKEKYTIVFSSGTTGLPKAMEIHSKGIEDFCHTFVNSFALNQQDKILNILPLYIITARMYLYSCIFRGINMVVSDIDKFSNALRKYQPTFFQSVPHLFESIYLSFYQMINSSFKEKLSYTSFNAFKFILSEKKKAKLQKKLFKDIHSFFGNKMKIMVTGSAPISIKTLHFFDNVGVRLYEAYGLTEIGVIASNTPSNYKLGSVGKKFGNKDIILDENNQVLVNSKHPFTHNFIDSEEQTKQMFREDGYINTGDIGYFDMNGFLHLNGRIKDIIVLKNGNKLFPVKIEKELENYSEIKQCMLFGDNKPFLIAVIVSNKDETVIREIIHEVNKRNSADYQIKGLFISQEDFTIENKMLSANMKMNRQNIHNKYRKQIEKLY